jgi:SAM-dependent methyltransferase
LFAPVSSVLDRRLERAARRWTDDRRGAGQLREHYTIERELAERLLRSSAAQRTALYVEVYDELFQRIAHHPQLRRRDSLERERQVARELLLLAPLLTPQSVFLEIGAGDLALSRQVARRAAMAHAVDVSAAIVGEQQLPANLHTHIIDGCHLPLADRTVTVAYSNQLMEHLHPDDAALQLREIFRVLAPGGVYLCITPNRLSGPWDISRMFSATPRGLHLREYSYGELTALFGAVGFDRDRFTALAPLNGRAWRVPCAPLVAAERVLQTLPSGAGRLLARSLAGKPLRSVRLLAHKPD